MNAEALFDAIRAIKGAPLTQAEVNSVNAALGASEGHGVDPGLIEALKKDEGFRSKAYRDTVGVWTVGYGATGPDIKEGVVWSLKKAEQRLAEMAKEHVEEMHKAIPWAKSLDPVRRRVLENMAYNLGVVRLLGFKNTLAFVQNGQYDKAAGNMLASKWAKQVKGRAVRLAREMMTGRPG